MRVLTANAASLGGALADVLDAADPTIAAITSFTPAQACAVAASLSLRYAVQCWDVPEAGKAILWKPLVPLQALYRAEFEHRDGLGVRAGQCGLLRVTLVWDGQPLHVFCAEVANDPRDADWQMVQVARELEGVKDAPVLIAGLDHPLPGWPELADAIASARWRSISYPVGNDLGVAARAAFGVTAGAQSAGSASAEDLGRLVRLLCSRDFSVVRACQFVSSNVPGAAGPLIVDLSSAHDDDSPNVGKAAASAWTADFARRPSARQA